MSGELGKASYELDANLEPLRRNIKESRVQVSDFERVLESLTAIADIAADQLKQVKIAPRQSAESEASASGILDGVRGISDEARVAARELDKVRITDRQAAESDVAGDVIDRKLKNITGNANEARRSLESVRLASGAAAGAGNRNPGAGVGPFGSGFGRIGLLGRCRRWCPHRPCGGTGARRSLAAIPALAGAERGARHARARVRGRRQGDRRRQEGIRRPGPSQQAFVQTVRSLDGWFDKLKETAAAASSPASPPD
jgi:hypothetical protein